jgi:integrase
LKRPAELLWQVGYQPHQVTQEVADALGRALEERQILRRPRPAFHRFINTWNYGQEHLPGWPDVRLDPAYRFDHYARPLGTFPIRFQQELMAYLAECERPSRRRGRKASRPATIRSRRQLLLGLASAALEAGRSGMDVLAALTRIDAVEAALNWIETRLEARRSADATQRSDLKTGHLHNSARAAVSLAKYLLERESDPAARRVHESNLRELKDLAASYRPEKGGMTAKNRGLVRRFNDEQLMRRLLTLPETILDEIGRRKRQRTVDAQRAAVAIAILILLYAPVRIRNLHSINLTVHYKVYGPAGRRVVLEFTEAETKNRVDLAFVLPARAVRLIDLYLKRYRLLLGDTGNAHLFPARCGQGLGPCLSSGLSARIARTVREKLGFAITAHQFRHICAFIYLRRNPGDYETVRRLLGHKSIQTTIAFYAGMESEAAVEKWDKTIEAILSEPALTGSSSSSRRA